MTSINERTMMIEAIKLAVGTTSYIGFPISGIYEAAIERLKKYYEETKEDTYLEAALLHIHAYMEMGYEYGDKKELFDYILSHLGTKRSVEFPRLYYTSKKIKLTRVQVRSMIQRWPASKLRMVMDIFGSIHCADDDSCLFLSTAAERKRYNKVCRNKE